jgi:hypothetical protein
VSVTWLSLHPVGDPGPFPLTGNLVDLRQWRDDRLRPCRDIPFLGKAPTPCDDVWTRVVPLGGVAIEIKGNLYRLVEQ